MAGVRDITDLDEIAQSEALAEQQGGYRGRGPLMDLPPDSRALAEGNFLTNVGRAFSPPNVLRKAEDLVRAGSHGATAGYNERLKAALGGTELWKKGSELLGLEPTYPKTGSYEEALEAERRRFQEIPATTRIPAEIAGSVATTAVGGPIIGAAKVPGMANLTYYTTRLKHLPTWAKATGLGALWGAAYGSEQAPQGEFLKDAAIGGGIGAGIGLGSHAAIAPIRRVAGNLGTYMEGKISGEGAPKAIASALHADDMTIERMRQRVIGLPDSPTGRQATLADLGGENVRGLARGASGTPGPSKRIAIKAYQNRAKTEGARIRQSLEANIAPADYFKGTDEFVRKLSALGDEAYSSIYAKFPSIPITPKLAKILDTAEGKVVLKRVARLAKTEEATSRGDASRFLQDVESLVSGENPSLSLQSWDRIKRGLDSIIDTSAYRSAKNPRRLNDSGRVVNNLKNDLLKELDNLTGGPWSPYKAARGIYSNTKQLEAASELGYKFYGKNPKLIAQEMKNLSEIEKKAYRNGAVGRLDFETGQGSKGRVAANAISGGKNRREAIDVIFPRSQFNKGAFQNDLAVERYLSGSTKEIISGSRTTPMAEELLGFKKLVGSLAAILGSSGGIPGGHALVRASAGRRLVQSWLGAPKKLDEELTRKLTTKSREEQLALLNEIAPYIEGATRTPKWLQSLIIGATGQQAKSREITREMTTDREFIE